MSGIFVQLLAGLLIMMIMPVLEYFDLDEKYNNCWYYAIRLWVKEGGYVLIEHSSWGWWGHYSHTLDMVNFTMYTTDGKHDRTSPPAIFHGYITKWILEPSVGHVA